jgi:hypothetical protein
MWFKGRVKMQERMGSKGALAAIAVREEISALPKGKESKKY